MVYSIWTENVNTTSKLISISLISILIIQINLRYAYIDADNKCPNEAGNNWAYNHLNDKKWYDSFGLTVKCI